MGGERRTGTHHAQCDGWNLYIYHGPTSVEPEPQLTWLLTLIGAPWFRFALIIVAIVAALAYVRGGIYQKGYDKARKECDAWKISTLQDVVVQRDRIHRADTKTVTRVAREVEVLKSEIQSQPSPNLCNTSECLHKFNSPIRTIRSHSTGTDDPLPPSKGG